jgi:hypothetical protein
MSSLLAALSPQQLRRAAELKEKIEPLEKQLGDILGSPSKIAGKNSPKKKFKMSAVTRAKIAAAAGARWAKVKAGKKK